MIIKTKGIVLSYIKYGETSIICKIYTEENSIQSFIINGIRKSKSKNTALYQPLTILDLVIYQRSHQEFKESKKQSLILYIILYIQILKNINLLLYV